jgi:hypothetical protein
MSLWLTRMSLSLRKPLLFFKKDVMAIGVDLKKVSKEHADRLDGIVIKATKAMSETKRIEGKFQRDCSLMKTAINKGTKVARFSPCVESFSEVDATSTDVENYRGSATEGRKTLATTCSSRR